MLTNIKLSFSSLALGVCLCLFVFSFQGSVHAATEGSLYSVLQSVYNNNPKIIAERVEFDKAKERIKEANSGWYPDISLNGSASSILTEPGSFGTKTGETANIGLSVEQFVYRGGRTIAELSEAELLSEVQKSRVNSVEQAVLWETLSVYISILKNKKIIVLREKNVANLRERLSFEEARYTLGENTVTDISQAKSRFASAKAELAQSRGVLANDISRYENISGVEYIDIEKIDVSKIDFGGVFIGFKNVESFITEALLNHPDIVQAKLLQYANKKHQRAIKGELYPSLSLVGSVQRSFRPVFSSTIPFQDQSQISLQASLPLYASGSIRSRLKQSKHDGKRLDAEHMDIERDVKENVKTAWQNIEVLKAEKTARLVQVESADLALDGVREEFSLGGRSTLDVLDAEEEKLNADVALASLKYDLVLSEFSLLASVGGMSLKKISVLLQ